MKKNYVIVGSGVAAVHGAKEIRDFDKDANILIFGEESLLPYNRMKLSKELYSDLYAVKNLIKKDKFYEKNELTYYQDAKVIGIDVVNKEITTSTQETVKYEKLLLSMGAVNRVLPIDGIDKEGVFTIRHIKTTDIFKEYVEDKEHIVLIGGGVQNLEIAWSLLQQGKKVTILEAAPMLMGRQLDKESSQIVKEKLEENGATIHIGATVHEIVGNTSVEGVRINNNEVISCDAVVYSVGIVPNIDLVKDTGIEVNRGIIVNDRMETSVEDIYAAGDVVEYDGKVAGLWGSALEQGKVAGNNMASSEIVIYREPVPVTILQACGLALFSLGCVDESICETITEQDDQGRYVRLFIKDNKIVGTISFEGVAAMLPYKTAIEKAAELDFSNKTISEIIEEAKQ